MTYDYLCTACGHEWEADQRISEPPLESCPACAKKAARRMISGGAGFILKGGGWYADGYASHGSKPADTSSSKTPKADSSSSSGSKSASPAKGDSATKSAAA